MTHWPLLLPLAFVVLSQHAAAQEDPWADDDWGEDEWADEDAGLSWSGFVEAGLGARINTDPLIDNRNSLEDLRWRVESEWQPDDFSLSLKGDGRYDGIENEWSLDIRDLTLAMSAGASTDLRLGRQVLTWGTGDLVFLNDLFPKDFVSFFSGRDDEYLKAPGNAIRLTHYDDAFNVDFVWAPAFEPDLYLTGERFPFFSPLTGGSVAPVPPLSAVEPGRAFSNGEFALRLFKTVKGTEYALYAYRGFFKQPNALTPALEPTFAPLGSYGASLRRSLGRGLFNTEFSFYDSRDDRSGDDPLIPNSQFRFLLGYEWEAKPNFTVGLQYYLESTLDHDRLIASSPFPEFEPDEFRSLVTNRLTYRAGMDRFTYSLFSFWSPSDRDFYLRPKFTYRHSDTWSIDLGGNLFGGDKTDTFFGQLQDASNAYLRIRFHY